MLAAVLLATGRVALAEGPGCTKEDIYKAANSFPGVDREHNLQAIEAKLAECKGKLTASEEAEALQGMYRYYMHDPRDYEGCRRVLGRVIQLGEVFGYAQFNDDFGYCGGDCSKSPRPRDCLEGVERRNVEVNAKVGSDIEDEQPVPCNLTKARKLLSGLDKAYFLDQALRFIAKYRTDCKQAGAPATRVALANDEALVHFHGDDDVACLRALDSIPSSETGDSEATAFNRALCGGPCTSSADKCAVAAASRRKALEARVARTKLRAKMQEDCWDCKPGQPCNPLPREDLSRSYMGSRAVAWDLKTLRHCDIKGCGAKTKPFWIGDINGDGIGDFLEVFSSINRDAQTRGLRGPDTKPFRYLDFQAWLGCGAQGKYLNGATITTEQEPSGPPPDQYSLGITDRPGSTIKSFCVYPGRRVKCSQTECDEKPSHCGDLSEWEVVERGAKAR